MRLKITIAALSLVLGTQASAGDRPTYQSLWDAVSNESDCKSQDDTDLIIFTCEKTYTLWYFTKPGNPAHPGVVRRLVIDDSKGGSIREDGWSFASDAEQPAFKTFLAQIRALDEQMKDAIATQHSQTTNDRAPIRIGGNWTPQGSDNQAVISLTSRFFALEDGGHYEDAYELMDAGLTAQLSFTRYQDLSDDVRGKVGRITSRELKAIDWEYNSPLGPPGLYAAVDYTAGAENGQLCGFVVWRKQPDGFFILVREETNTIPKAVSAEEAAKLQAQFHCVT